MPTARTAARFRTSVVRAFTLLGLILLVDLASGQSSLQRAESRRRPERTNGNAVVGDVEKLRTRYERWRTNREESESIVFGLGWSKARSPLGRAELRRGRGVARLKPNAARLEVDVAGLGDRRIVDVWVIPYSEAPGFASARRIGTIQLRNGYGELRASTLTLGQLELERLVVTDAGGDIDTQGLLHGAPGLFERIAWRRGDTVGGIPVATNATSQIPTTDADLERLVGVGERLFFRETFEGNGRTCGTCHPAEHDFTIDPAFIATLPPTDPLFVGERLAALDSERNGGLVFENPQLMREQGLIVVNADGFDDPSSRFVMRGVQHLMGLARTIEPAPSQLQPLDGLLGWSGDGSTGSGTLREFAEGAVRQHFPLTMNRVAGEDFRLPTPKENNAFEAFLLSIGRNEDMDLDTLRLSNARADSGRQLFSGIAGCNLCHRNGGSNSFFPGGIGVGDFIVNTGVERMTQDFPDGTGQARPIDGGFGTTPEGNFAELVPNPDGSFGKRTFNSQSAIEAASTTPSFHSNLNANPANGLEPTIEGAVRFYTTLEFREEAGFPIFLNEEEIQDVGRFLRSLSALDDIATAKRFAERAAQNFGMPELRLQIGSRQAELAAIEARDAISVLEPVNLNPGAVTDLANAATALDGAMFGTPTDRIAAIEMALASLASARERIED